MGAVLDCHEDLRQRQADTSRTAHQSKAPLATGQDQGMIGKLMQMAIERIYNIPLRKEFQKAPKYRRAAKAMIALREFIAKHMRADLDSVKIGEYANLALWKRGMQYPPHHIKIKAVKADDGKVTAELVGAPEKKVAEQKEKKKAEKSIEQVATETKAEGAQAEKTDKPKKLGKKALQKEMQQMHQKVGEAIHELKEKTEEHLKESQHVEQEEIKELQHDIEAAKKHKPKEAKQDRSQYNKKKEMIPGRKDK